jgi:hypothetical protein
MILRVKELIRQRIVKKAYTNGDNRIINNFKN